MDIYAGVAMDDFLTDQYRNPQAFLMAGSYLLSKPMPEKIKSLFIRDVVLLVGFNLLA
jgi:hypothetical protein